MVRFDTYKCYLSSISIETWGLSPRWHRAFKSFCVLNYQMVLRGTLLTRLTRLIHTSVLPSNWNLGKIQLGQVHMVKKYFLNSSMHKPFSFNSFYLLVLRKISNSATKTTILETSFFTICDLLLQKFCRDSNLRVKLLYELVN